ncbi:hypothetical protein KEM48_011423 [Puccinia striiformis f. sp. tritici PST-130]|nr:hypothetical protein KEM48_011423 [Puccinia striiformis f. sp. tritici PST-130]
MRCMAICYVGPRNAPDLTKDHHISPIFTPSSILARFPPVYLVCGEKDPFVDDTVIIAGKIREAKQQRKREALAKLQKDSGGPDFNKSTKLDPILEEEEADWVQMRIFEGWSHGFAQMLSLLPELRPRAESGSRSVSPSPRLWNARPTRAASGFVGSALSNSATQHPNLPALRVSQGQSESSNEISLSTPTSVKPTSTLGRATPKALVDLTSLPRLLSSHLPFFPPNLHRFHSREEADMVSTNGTPEDHFKQLEFTNDYAPVGESSSRVNEDDPQGQYVGEKDLLERRWMDAAYGINHNTSQSKSFRLRQKRQLVI